MGLLDQTSADLGGLWTSYGPMLPLTAYTEQIPLFNAMNFNGNVYDNMNQTISSTGVATIWCPSDPGVQNGYVYSGGFTLGGGTNQKMNYSSYAGMAGTWYNTQFGVTGPGAQNGVFYAYSVTLLANITDGTSNTIMFAEHTRAIEQGADVVCWHWWTSGNYGDTICNAFWPINPNKKLPYSCRPNDRFQLHRCGVEPPPGRCQRCSLRRFGPFRQGDHRLLEKRPDRNQLPARGRGPRVVW